MKTTNKETLFFYKGTKIADQAKKIAQGLECPDCEALDDFIINNSHAQNFIETVTDSCSVENLRVAAKNEDKQNSLLMIEQKMEKRMNARRRRRLVVSLSSVAAAVMFLSFCLFYPEKEGERSVVAENERSVVAPTLILSTGDVLTLEGDSMHLKKEIIAEDGVREPKINKIIIPSRYTYTVVLEDGTTVLLNAQSELSYPEKFSGGKREVFLHGEAFFNVKKGATPFIVTTDDLTVKVYGTSFTLSTDDVRGTEALLLSGSVGLEINDSGEEVLMKPNQFFEYNKTSGQYGMREVDPDNYMAWTRDSFQCDEEALSVMLDKIARWYGVRFEYPNEMIQNMKIDLKISRQSELKDILKSIEAVSGAVIIRKNNDVYVIE